MTQIFGKSANYSQIEGSAVPLQLRWRPLAAAEAGAAASGAAGVPVWWPRRPAAVSEAAAAGAMAGAGPDFSCAGGELEQPLKALIGEVRSLSVVCVCASVFRVFRVRELAGKSSSASERSAGRV